jgi:hypothetical protein
VRRQASASNAGNESSANQGRGLPAKCAAPTHT